MLCICYCAALVSVSEEVRSRCHLKHRLAQHMSESASNDSINTELVSGLGQQVVSYIPLPQVTATSPQQSYPPSSQITAPNCCAQAAANAAQATSPCQPPNTLALQAPPMTATPRRQKSFETLDQNAMAQARMQKNPVLTQVQVGEVETRLCYFVCCHHVVLVTSPLQSITLLTSMTSIFVQSIS